MATPPVYGYVWIARRNASRLESWRRLIAAYCRGEGLCLESVLADSSQSESRRPGWTALLDRIAASDSGAVVVLITPDHLSRDHVTRAAMWARIYAAGGRVVQVPTVGGVCRAARRRGVRR